MSNHFGGMGSATVFGAGQYIQPGVHDLEVKNVSVIASQRNPGRHFFCVEFRVAKSEVHPVGSTVTWLVDLEKPSKDTAFSNIKEFACALLGVEATEVTEDVMDAMCTPEQPSAGMGVVAEAWHKSTQAGGVFTRIRWQAPDAGAEVSN